MAATPPAPKFFAKPAQWRAWLAKHHTKRTEQWVGFWRVSSGKPSITWPQSVDEALCHGWIDGLRKSLGPESYMIRFTPRRADSIWSRVNMTRYRELDAAGLVTSAGRAAWERRTEKRSAVYAYERGQSRGHFELDAAREKTLRAHKQAFRFLAAQTPGYQKLARGWVMNAKREETRVSRFAALLDSCARGVPIPPLKWVKLKQPQG
jgi:uncharacterized protein YdeI (YjbR/CyaY-like superfamily)